MVVSEEESTSLSVNIFEDLVIIVTKDESCKTDASDDFATDRKQKCSNNNSALVIALKEPINRQLRDKQFRDKQFIIGSLLMNLQHHSHINSLSGGKQILVKKTKKISIFSVQKYMIYLNQSKKLQNQLKTEMKILKLIKGQLVTTQMVIVL